MEKKKKVINLEEIGKQLNVPAEDFTFPDGHKMTRQKWGKEHFNKTLELLQPNRKESDTILLVTNSPGPWITMGLMIGMKPLTVNYLYPRPDGVELEMSQLKRGLQKNNYDVIFETFEEGDKLFINMTSDRQGPEIKGHTFDTANLSKVMIPWIPSGKDVFIHAKGMFCVMVCVALNYVKDSRSVSIACLETDYFCGYSSDPAREVGDMEKRTLPNNL